MKNIKINVEWEKRVGEVISQRKKLHAAWHSHYNYAWLKFIDFSLIDYELR
jgi:hypothetical protein